MRKTEILILVIVLLAGFLYRLPALADGWSNPKTVDGWLCYEKTALINSDGYVSVTPGDANGIDPLGWWNRVVLFVNRGSGDTDIWNTTIEGGFIDNNGIWTFANVTNMQQIDPSNAVSTYVQTGVEELRQRARLLMNDTTADESIGWYKLCFNCVDCGRVQSIPAH